MWRYYFTYKESTESLMVLKNLKLLPKKWTNKQSQTITIILPLIEITFTGERKENLEFFNIDSMFMRHIKGMEYRYWKWHYLHTISKNHHFQDPFLEVPSSFCELFHGQATAFQWHFWGFPSFGCWVEDGRDQADGGWVWPWCFWKQNTRWFHCVQPWSWLLFRVLQVRPKRKIIETESSEKI